MQCIWTETSFKSNKCYQTYKHETSSFQCAVPPKNGKIACFHPFTCEGCACGTFLRTKEDSTNCVQQHQSTCPKLTKIRFFFFSYTEHTYLFYASHICRKIERRLPQLKKCSTFRLLAIYENLQISAS